MKIHRSDCSGDGFHCHCDMLMLPEKLDRVEEIRELSALERDGELSEPPYHEELVHVYPWGLGVFS